MFDLYQSGDAQAVKETMTVLSDFIQRMHAEQDVQEEQRADAVAAAQSDIIHLDALPTQQSVEDWAARLAPFSPPAAPASYEQVETEPEAEAHSAYDVSDRINQHIVPLPSAQTEKQRTFRQHVAARRHGMLLISVKRQRKLKMKKHKYKKLMKRTRLLRRKLDRT